MNLKKSFSYLLIGFLALVSIAVLGAPGILSTKWGQDRIIASINQEIPGHLDVEKISLSWFGKQSFKNIRLLDPKSRLVASAEYLETDTSLFSLLFKRPQLGNSYAKALNAALDSGLTESLGAKYVSPETFPRLVQIKNADLHVVNSSEGFKLIASGQTESQGKLGSFDVDCLLTQKKNALKVQIVDLPVEILDALSSMQGGGNYGVIRQILGDTLSLNISEVNGVLNVVLHSNLEMELDGAFEGDHFVLRAPMKSSLNLTPAAFDKLRNQMHALSHFKLAQPAKLALQMDTANIPLSLIKEGMLESSLGSLSGNLLFSVSGLKWKDGFTGLYSEVDRFQISLEYPQDQLAYKLSVKGDFVQDGKIFPIELHSTHIKPDRADIVSTVIQPRDMLVSFNDVNTSTLDAFLGTGKALQETFGNALSMHLQSSKDDLQTMKITLSSENIEIPSMELKVTNAFQLGRKWDQVPISGKLAAKQIRFKKQNSALKALKVDWKLDLQQKQAEALFSSESVIAGSKEDGKIGGSISANYQKPNNLRLFAKIDGEQVPSAFLTMMTNRHEWEPLFGPSVNLKIHADLKDLSGPFSVHVNGLRGSLAVDGQLSQGVFTLNAPLMLETEVSKELTKEVLGELSPVFKELHSADNSLRLTVDPLNFSMPLTLELSDINFERAVLELGKVTFVNGGDVHRLLNVLKAEQTPLVKVWATPMLLNMRKGTLTVYRMDMLVMDRYPIATWGKIDFPADRVNMVMGLSSTALAQSLGIRNLPSNYMLQIPIKGTTSNTKIDSSKVMGRLGSLMAQSSGGPEGFVIGTVLDLANGKDPQVPPPTTNPLPWQGLMTEKESSSTKPTHGVNPVNAIRKEASKLLKDIFR
jgi:hypothetical protein